jgi:hypothetical protein
MALSYATMYWLSLIIPVISVFGAVLGSWNARRLRIAYERMGRSKEEICELLRTEECTLQPNWHILGGSGVFVAASLFLGLSTFSANKEIIFFASLAIIIYLMRQLLEDLDPRGAAISSGSRSSCLCSGPCRGSGQEPVGGRLTYSVR